MHACDSQIPGTVTSCNSCQNARSMLAELRRPFIEATDGAAFYISAFYNPDARLFSYPTLRDSCSLWGRSRSRCLFHQFCMLADLIWLLELLLLSPGAASGPAARYHSCLYVKVFRKARLDAFEGRDSL